MDKPLSGKRILIVEDEAVFRTLLYHFLTSLGAEVSQVENGIQALGHFVQHSPEMMICDLTMPEMDGAELIENLRRSGHTLPILVISATEHMSDIARVLRLGVQDVLLKPLNDMDRLREAVFECLYPCMFTSKVEEDEQLFHDWDALVRDPAAATRLLLELQPPAQQNIAGCQINYRQLTSAERPGLVLDIAALSDRDLAFYCLDVVRAGDNGVLAALLLRALFNGLLQEQLSGQSQRLPKLNALLTQVNHLLRQVNLDGQFPLLIGYYNRESKNLILVSAGLGATFCSDGHKIPLTSGVPLGVLGSTHVNQTTHHCEAWQCQIMGSGARLNLMLATEQS